MQEVADVNCNPEARAPAAGRMLGLNQAPSWHQAKAALDRKAKERKLSCLQDSTPMSC